MRKVVAAGLVLSLQAALATPLSAELPSTAPCGWAVPAGETLAFEADRRLDPRRSGALPKPPAKAVAAYCRRDSMVVEHPDFRVLRELRLPYIVENRGRFGVLQLAPGIVLNYHTEGDRFVPGRAPEPEEQKTRT